jgi:DNA-binding CsgD family transcriptional regulator
VLFTVLAAFVALSLILQVNQLARFVAEGRSIILAFWATNVAIAVVFVVLLVVGRNGRPRLAAGVLTILVGLLAIGLLLTDGVDKPMWILVVCLELVLAVVLLGGAGASTAFGATALLAMTIAALQQGGVIEPLLPAEAQRTTDLGALSGVVAVAGFIALVCWIYTRDVLVSIDQALTHSSSESPLRRLRTKHLSMREIEVVQLVAAGLSNDAIAARLFISPRTAQSHVANAIRKTSSSNRTELGVLAIREGIVPLEEGAVPPLQATDTPGGETAARTA